MSDSFTWQLLGADGVSVVNTMSGFPSQADAEAWLGEDWQSLLDDGVEAVTLMHGPELVYGPMNLRGEQ